ncbi:diguanylate cyclase [Hwanghaeella grinnelliae]|uniref:diguanylate cyclase n=1 Tax=Hwanghaeella grinnelliae TaxID=2500179 RepID=A0A437QXT2_9PROT|nr:diguanylate cyclase [Hwanghaeella grinnelliae]
MTVGDKKIGGKEIDGGGRGHGLGYYVAIYSAALALIAAFGVGTFFLSDRIITEEARSATLVRIATRQTTLSQRISGLAFQYAMANPQQRRYLEPLIQSSIGLMRSSHEALLMGDAQLGLPGGGFSDDIDEMFFGEAEQLDYRVRRFMTLAEDFLELPQNFLDEKNQGLIRLLAAAQDELMDSLTEVATAYEDASRDRVRKLRERISWLLASFLAVVALEGVLVFRPLFRTLVRHREELYNMARTDPLTGCFNRRALMESAENEFARARRYKSPLTIAMFDIDRFKKVNDTYGHAAGDEVIKNIVTTATESIRTVDIFGRTGGEEFAIVLPDTGTVGASIVAEKLRSAVEHSITEFGGQNITVTVSVGIGFVMPGDQNASQALSRADQALYRAKQTGRNRVNTFELEEVGATD